MCLPKCKSRSSLIGESVNSATEISKLAGYTTSIHTHAHMQQQCYSSTLNGNVGGGGGGGILPDSGGDGSRSSPTGGAVPGTK